MRILSIDTSCDETAAAVTEDTKVLSNIVWSQASLHARWGGVFPSLAQREHKTRIDFVIKRALGSKFRNLKGIDAIAVTVGPGLAVALEVGIAKAKHLSKTYKKPLLCVNHIEGHILSVLAKPKNIKNKKSKSLDKPPAFPTLAFVASGGTTELIIVKEVGKYKVVAQTMDDALGEALDKAARMLGLGYPGGAVLEKIAKNGNPDSYLLPVPMSGQEDRLKFSYSGLKTALYRLIEKEKPLTREKIINLAASYQNAAFQHAERLIKRVLSDFQIKELWFSGGVSANTELRKRIRKICRENEILLRLPYSKKLCTDNAAMIGVAAFFKSLRGEFTKDLDTVERVPRLSVEEYP